MGPIRLVGQRLIFDGDMDSVDTGVGRPIKGRRAAGRSVANSRLIGYDAHHVRVGREIGDHAAKIREELLIRGCISDAEGIKYRYLVRDALEQCIKSER